MRIKWLLLFLACGCGSESTTTSTDASVADAEAGTLDAQGGADAGDGSLGPVQCRSAEDCMRLNPTEGCFQSKPGGVCANCNGDNGKCPAGTECISGGTGGTTECAYPCTRDQDCNVG